MADRLPVGLIGLGLLGSALGERFLASGFVVCGWDAEPARRAEFATAGGSVAASGRDVAATCRRIVLCLPNSDIVRHVLADLEPELRRGDLIVDTTTGDPDATSILAQDLAQRRIGFVDATIGGSSRQTRARDVIVMPGGEEADVAAARDLFDAFARVVFHVGPPGSGARMKLVVNLVLGLHRAVLGEGLGFARSLGLDPRQALEILRAGPTWSRVMEIKGEKMLTGDFAPEARLAQHLKDVRLILEAGQGTGAALPLSGLHAELLEQLVSRGLGELDNSVVVRAFEG